MNNIKNKQPKEYYAIFSKYGFAVYSSFRRLEQDKSKFTGTSVPSLNSFYSTYRLNKYYS